MLVSSTIVLAACAGPTSEDGSQQSSADLLGRTFESTSVVIDGETHELVAGPLEVAFEDRDPDQIVRFEAGCNTFGARFEITGERLNPEEVHDGQDGPEFPGTDQACADEQHDQDAWLSEVFASAPNWELDEDELTLSTESVTIELAET